MDEKELIMDLEGLAKVLDELPDLKDDQRIENIWNMYNTTSDKLLHYKIYNEIDTEEATLLRSDMPSLEAEKELADKSVSNIEAEIKRGETVYANTQKSISELKEALKVKGLSERKKADIELSIRKCEQILENIKNQSEKLKSELSSAKEKQKKVTDSLNDKKNKLEKLYKEESDKLESDAQTLYFAYDFFASNPKQEIQSTINDLKDGIVDIKTVNNRLQNLKVLLSSGLYNLDEINKKVRENRKKEIAEAIELQVKKVREDNNIDFYEKQIKFQDDMIKRKDGDLTSRQALRDEYKRMVDYLFVNGKGADKLRGLYELQSAYEVGDKVNENTFSDVLDRLINKTGGEKLVEKVDRQVPNYFPEEYLQILDKATIDSVNQKIDDEINKSGLTENDVIPLINDGINKLESESPSKDLVPVGETGLTTIDGPKEEVKGVKDLDPSKLEKLKEWFAGNWKKVTVLGTTAALSLALLWSSCSGAKKDNNKEAATAKEQTVAQVTYKPVEQKKVEPIVETKPTHHEERPEPVVTPEPGVTPEPEPEVTPEPKQEDIKLRTEEKIQEDHGLVGDSRPADPDMSPQLHGNSVVLEDPTTNTKVYIDSEGSSVVVKNDGTVDREENAIQVEPLGDGTVVVHNPEPVMKETIEKADAVENTQPPENPISLDDYNKQVAEEVQHVEEQKDNGMISADDAAKIIADKEDELNRINAAFDEMFNDLSVEKEGGSYGK